MKIILYKSILFTLSMLIFILMSEKIFNFKDISRYVTDQKVGKLEEPWYHKSLRYFMITIEQNISEYLIVNVVCSLIGGFLAKKFKIPQLLFLNHTFYILISFLIINFIAMKYFISKNESARGEPTDSPDSPSDGYIDPNDGDERNEDEGINVSLKTKLNSTNVFKQIGLYSTMSIENYPITILLVSGFAFSSDIIINIISNIFNLEESE